MQTKFSHSMLLTFSLSQKKMNWNNFNQKRSFCGDTIFWPVFGKKAIIFSQTPTKQIGIYIFWPKNNDLLTFSLTLMQTSRKQFLCYCLAFLLQFLESIFYIYINHSLQKLSCSQFRQHHFFQPVVKPIS